MNYKFYKKIIFPAFIVAITTAISFFYFSFTSNNIIYGLFSDDAVYLLQAELYSPWQSYISPAVNYIREQSLFPPLYPILLGIFGADSNHLVSASNITISFLLISLFITGYFTYLTTHSKTIAIILPCIIVGGGLNILLLCMVSAYF